MNFNKVFQFQLPPRSISMPPLVPISGSTSSPNLPKTPLSQRQMLEAVKGGSSLLKAQTPSTPVSSSSTPSTIAPAIPAAPTVDPLQEMMANEKQQNKPLPGTYFENLNYSVEGGLISGSVFTLKSLS